MAMGQVTNFTSSLKVTREFFFQIQSVATKKKSNDAVEGRRKAIQSL